MNRRLCISHVVVEKTTRKERSTAASQYRIASAGGDYLGFDLEYVAKELREAGLDVVYERESFVPDRRIWASAAERAIAGDLHGWCYVLTPAVMVARACREELVEALACLSDAKGNEFPLVAIVLSGDMQDVPTILRPGVCVSLADPSWRKQVLAAIQ